LELRMRDNGSSPVVGSSRKTIFGDITEAIATCAPEFEPVYKTLYSV